MINSLSKHVIWMLSAIVFFCYPVVYAATTDQIINAEEKRINDGQRSQQRIDTIADKTDTLVTQFRNESKIVDGLKVYNQQLERQLNNQQAAINSLKSSIQEAAVVERQIVPLMVKMIDALDVFVNADLPFSLSERRERIENLKAYLNDANISAAERFRKVLEAYEIENAYGRSIETYTDQLKVGDQVLAVNVLRIGRIGLYYQTKNGKKSAVWDKQSSTWIVLDSQYNRNIRQSIRIAAKQLAPDLLTLPVASPEGV